MVAPFSHRRSIFLPFDIADRAAFALSGLTRWVGARDLLSASPVLATLLESARSVTVELDAALRLAERLDRNGQPSDPAELAVWRIVEDVLQRIVGVQPPRRDLELARYYAAERFAWTRRPANLRELTHEQVELWATAVFDEFRRLTTGRVPLETDPLRPAAKPDFEADAAVFDEAIKRVSERGVR